MPSKAGLIIADKIQQYLERALTEEELIKCDELNLNYYTQAILGYVSGLIKKNSPKDFEIVYTAIMNGLLRGAYRRHDLIYIRGRLETIYRRMHALTGDGMSNSELEAIIFLAEDCTDKEIDAAIAVARNRGINHIKYVRAVVEGNRKAVSRSAAKRFKKFVPVEYEERTKVSVPRVDVIREQWKRRLAKTRSKIELAKAELNTRNRLAKR